MARRKRELTDVEKYEEFLFKVKPFLWYGYSLNRVINKWNAQCIEKWKEDECYVWTTVYKWFEKEPALQIRFDVENTSKLDDLDMKHYDFAIAQVKDTEKWSPQAAQWILSRKHPDYKENWDKTNSISVTVQSEDLEYAREMISKIKI